MKKINIIILVIIIGSLSFGCQAGTISQKTNHDDQKNKETDKEVLTYDLNSININEYYFNAIDRYYKMLEEKRRLAKLKRESMRYVLKDTTLYNDSAFETQYKTVDKRSILYLVDFNEETKIAKVKESFESEDVFYVKGTTLTDSLEGFIRNTYEGVDYGYVYERKDFESNPRVKVKGIYLTINSFLNPKKLDALIEKANNSEINAFVIDIKNDSGHLLFKSEAAKAYVPSAYNSAKVDQIDDIMEKLRQNDIYTIARLVTFKSPQYAKTYPERAITYKGTNQVYVNSVAWASAYDRNLWDYNIQLAKEALDHGFNEIQFDYVRFPAMRRSTRKKLDMKNELNETRAGAIHNFLIQAQKEIYKKEGYLSADIFGWATSSITDEGIGHHWEAVITPIDAVSPMIYPSHYGPGNYGFKVPDANPYGTIYAAMEDAINRNKNVKSPAALRPWLQDFSAPWVDGYIPYNEKEVRAQIKALEDLGIEEYILWSPSNIYTWEALK